MDNEYNDQNGYDQNGGTAYDQNAYNGYDQNPYNGYDPNAYNQNYYNGYGYGYYGQPPYPPVEKTNPLAIVSMVLGIISLVIAVFLCCYSFGMNLPFAIAAVVTGVLQMKSKTNQKGRGMSTAGVITGGISILLSIIYLILAIVIIIISIAADSSSHSYYY